MLIADRLSLVIVVPRALIPAVWPDFQLFKELQVRWLLEWASPLWFLVQEAYLLVFFLMRWVFFRLFKPEWSIQMGSEAFLGHLASLPKLLDPYAQKNPQKSFSVRFTLAGLRASFLVRMYLNFWSFQFSNQVFFLLDENQLLPLTFWVR